MLKLKTDGYSIAINDDPAYSPGSTDNARRYDRDIQLDSANGLAMTSRHSVSVLDGSRVLTSVILLAGGGASGVHERSAIALGDACFVAVGPYVASLAVPSLELCWSTEADDATCFGIYYSQSHGLLVSHGELEIAALTLDGTLVWTAGGADLFTNGFELRDQTIHVWDFNDRPYVFDIASGAERME